MRVPTKVFMSLATIVALPASSMSGPALAGDSAVHAVIFESLDVGPSVFTTTGFKAAPGGIDREGFAILGAVGSGLRFERGPVKVTGRVPTVLRMTVAGSVLAGYQHFADWGVVSLFAGPEASFESLSTRPLPMRYGLRIQGELWARPSENTLLTVTLIAGSARSDLYARSSLGYRIFGCYLGPEIAHYVDRTGYRRWNLGLHATDFAIGPISLRAAVGYQYEAETTRAAPYLSLAGWITL